MEIQFHSKIWKCKINEKIGANKRETKHTHLTLRNETENPNKQQI